MGTQFEDVYRRLQAKLTITIAMVAIEIALNVVILAKLLLACASLWR